jgi:hypothetical protein
VRVFGSTAAALVLAARAGSAVAGEADLPAPAAAGPPALAAAADEREALARLLQSPAWSGRALAALRLERYGCPESEAALERLLEDGSWPVRVFALRALGRRGAILPEQFLGNEGEPRVLRAALRHGYRLDAARLERGVSFLARSEDLDDKMLAAELGSASGNPDLEDEARELLRTVILRMSRIEAGALSPRIAALTGEPDLRRNYLWINWLREANRRFAVLPVRSVPEPGRPAPPPGMIAALEPQQFAELEGYVAELGRMDVDLAVCIDCTSSMNAELADAQGGIDDLMRFAGEMVGTLRVAIVAYRDVREEFETRAWDFTADVATVRRNLWSLAAAGGGDPQEAVYPALRLAFGRLGWNSGRTGVLVLVGDGPPHVGYGTQCADMARRAAAFNIVTHAIEADERGVKFFPEIAAAGGGRLVSLPAEGEDALIIEIAGMTLGERYREALREFFRVYLALCR